jgi:hypothetical protein
VSRLSHEVDAKINRKDDAGSSLRPMSTAAPPPSVTGMKRRALFIFLALALLVLAVGGWLVQGLRYPPRLRVAAAR